ncbi:uncharacterized protein J8A68_000744 [[Candida] subhashii]|uniref:Ribosomal RNA-processing protein 1 n=1 Tax=[Candida] subhashii TaxID=561895 RepID=A0A8J5QR47_9ASCO|nr:uncharacterized protein J8A68_000744 [[Candida] subhashii]KAG7665724.1 hypothetical protein J8A68_000744 [[Candida] subhashii]
MSTSSAFVKKLASNDRPTREAALESLKRFLSSKSSKKLSELDLSKLWKGLYYSMWFCDRPRAQERLAEQLGSLFSDCISRDQFCSFVSSFWVIMISEWPNVDQWRVDKYYLLIRRVLRHNFKMLKLNNWDEELVKNWLEVLEKEGGVLSGDKKIAYALPYHICDIYLDELELIIFEELKGDQEVLENYKKDDKEYIELYESLFKRKLQIVEDIPIKQLISPFEHLNKDALLKTLREKCADEVLNDERLKDWGVVEDDESDSEEDGEADSASEDEDESEDEWKGF